MAEHNFNVLVVDDDPAYRKVLTKLLETKLNCAVFQAENPRDAFEYLSGNRPDLLIIDMQMPIMDGYSAIMHIRAIPDQKDLPVIVYSALSSSTLIKELVRLGVADFIVKPSTTETIIEKIAKVLKTIQERRVNA